MWFAKYTILAISIQERNKEKQWEIHIKTGRGDTLLLDALQFLLWLSVGNGRMLLSCLWETLSPLIRKTNFTISTLSPISPPLHDNKVGAGNSLHLLSSSCSDGTPWAYLKLIGLNRLRVLLFLFFSILFSSILYIHKTLTQKILSFHYPTLHHIFLTTFFASPNALLQTTFQIVPPFFSLVIPPSYRIAFSYCNS